MSSSQEAFFKVFQTQYGFFIKDPLKNPEDNFKALAEEMNWIDPIIFKKRYFQCFNREFQEDKQKPSKYFLQHQIHNNFHHNPKNLPNKEFNRLAMHMRWVGQARKLNREIFKKNMLFEKNENDKENINFKESEQSDDIKTTEFLKKSANQQKSTKFFDEFVNSDGFIRIPNNDIYDEFERLAEHMEWDKKEPFKIELYNYYKELFLDSLKIKEQQNEEEFKNDFLKIQNPIEQQRNQEEIKNDENNAKNGVADIMNLEKSEKNENNSKIEVEFRQEKKESQTIEKQNFIIDYSVYNISKKSQKKPKNKPKTPSEYFQHFEKFMRFPYDKKNNHLMEFEKMAKFFNWNSTQYKSEKNKLLALVKEEKKINSNENNKIKNTIFSETANLSQNNARIFEESKKNQNSKILQTQKNARFFDDYVRDFKFELIPGNDHYTEFNRLAKHMNWNKNHQIEIHRLAFQESLLKDWAEEDKTKK